MGYEVEHWVGHLRDPGWNMGQNIQMGWHIGWDMLSHNRCKMICLLDDVVLHNSMCNMLVSNLPSVKHESGLLLMMQTT